MDSPGLFILRSVFTKLLKYYFSDASHLIVYGDDLACEIDKFTIQPGNIIDPGNTNHVPGIIITTGEGISYETPWMQAQMLRSPDFATARNVHSAKVNMTFSCLHFDADVVAKISDAILAFGVSSEILLFETWNWLKYWHPVQQTSPHLARKAQEPEAFENYYEAQVIFELSFEYGTITRRESRRMQDYVLGGDHDAARTSVDITKDSYYNNS